MYYTYILLFIFAWNFQLPTYNKIVHITIKKLHIDRNILLLFIIFFTFILVVPNLYL